MIDQELITILVQNDYFHIRKLENGEWAGLLKMVFTIGLFVGLDETGYRTRFCYEHQEEAELAIEIWDGLGDPPGMWLKQKGGVERLGPGTFLKGLIEDWRKKDVKEKL